MISFIEKKRSTLTYRILSGFIAFTFIFSVIVPPTPISAQMVPLSVLDLPLPGAMISLSPGFNPPLVKGITIHPENPLKFDFLVSPGDDNLQGAAFRVESKRLIKYFLASLTVPDNELWVNLSPYEKTRVISQQFGQTEMGRDMLAQDYILKQLSASLMYPEDEIGKKFWDRVYKRAYEEYGTTEIPMNTFNKIWIVPEKAVVYEHEQTAFVVESHLKVMLEEDYIALQNSIGESQFGLDQVTESDAEIISGVSSEVVKEILIPEIEKEVNEGEIFTQLRQIYNSVILATWYKDNLKESLLGQIYVDKGKTKGVDVDDPQVNRQIYDRYVEAFKTGVFNYIKEDYDPATKQIIPRKYFSGGFNVGGTRGLRQDVSHVGPDQIGSVSSSVQVVAVNLIEEGDRKNAPVIAAAETEQARAEKAAASPIEVPILSAVVLRSEASITQGIHWKESGENIFGGGFGYDIRIDRTDALKYSDAATKFYYTLGRTLGGNNYLKHTGRALITGDMRLTSDAFRLALAQGLNDEGIDVTTQADGQIITTGLTTRKGLADGFDLIIQITGSHNVTNIEKVEEANGAKIVLHGEPFFQAQLVELSRDISARAGWSPTISEAGKLNKDGSMIQEHIDTLSQILPELNDPSNLIADFRGGAAGEVFSGIAEKKGYRIIGLNSVEDTLPDEVFGQNNQPVLITINAKPSPTMAYGIWDPSNNRSYDDIAKIKQRIAADPRFEGQQFAGLAFDGDGDRVGIQSEDGRIVAPDRMLIAYYQRFLLANQDGIRALNRIGHTLSLALDVRASEVIVSVIQKFAQDNNLDVIGEFIAAGYPNHRQFVYDEITKIQNIFSLLTSAEHEAVRKLMRDYVSAEASGHFFFKVNNDDVFFDKKAVVDDGITAAFVYLHITETLNEYEGIDERTVSMVDNQFPVLPVTSDTRLDKAPKDVTLKQTLVEDMLLEFARSNLDLIPMNFSELASQVATAQVNPPKRQSANDTLLLVDGIRINLTNGVWILLRKSNTSAYIVFKGEAKTADAQPALVDTMQKLLVSMRKVIGSGNPEYANLVLEAYAEELNKLSAASPVDRTSSAVTSDSRSKGDSASSPMNRNELEKQIETLKTEIQRIRFWVEKNHPDAKESTSSHYKHTGIEAKRDQWKSLMIKLIKQEFEDGTKALPEELRVALEDFAHNSHEIVSRDVMKALKTDKFDDAFQLLKKWQTQQKYFFSGNRAQYWSYFTDYNTIMWKLNVHISSLKGEYASSLVETTTTSSKNQEIFERVPNLAGNFRQVLNRVEKYNEIYSDVYQATLEHLSEIITVDTDSGGTLDFDQWIKLALKPNNGGVSDLRGLQNWGREVLFRQYFKGTRLTVVSKNSTAPQLQGLNERAASSPVTGPEPVSRRLSENPQINVSDDASTVSLLEEFEKLKLYQLGLLPRWISQFKPFIRAISEKYPKVSDLRGTDWVDLYIEIEKAYLEGKISNNITSVLFRINRVLVDGFGIEVTWRGEERDLEGNDPISVVRLLHGEPYEFAFDLRISKIVTALNNLGIYTLQEFVDKRQALMNLKPKGIGENNYNEIAAVLKANGFPVEQISNATEAEQAAVERDNSVTSSPVEPAKSDDELLSNIKTLEGDKTADNWWKNVQDYLKREINSENNGVQETAIIIYNTYPFEGDRFPPVVFAGKYSEKYDRFLPKIKGTTYEGEIADVVAGGKGAKVSAMANTYADQFPVWLKTQVTSNAWFNQHQAWLAAKGITREDIIQAIDSGDIALNVPTAFTITTEQTNRWMENGQKLSEELVQRILFAIALLEEANGKKLADVENDPLTVSARSGARRSMPGMMDTVLNLGLTPASIEASARRSPGSRGFFYDSYRRLIQMYGEIVLGIEDEDKSGESINFKAILLKLITDRSYATDQTELKDHDYALLVDRYTALMKTMGLEIPSTGREQILGAVHRIMQGSFNPEAIFYAQDNKISKEDATTGVTIQTMVRGNQDDQSGAGVYFTENVVNGLGGPTVQWDTKAQGEDVVAGRTTKKRNLDELKNNFPLIAFNLMTVGEFLQEEIYQNAQDIEPTFQSTGVNGKQKLYILQTRDAKRTTEAEFALAWDMAKRELISREEAVSRITAKEIANQMLSSRFDPYADKDLISNRGEAVSPGAGSGKIALTADLAEQWAREGQDVVLVRRETNPRDIHGMKPARAIYTQVGGFGSHAALVARQNGTPAGVGDTSMSIDYQNRTVTWTDPQKGVKTTLHEGDYISVDGTGIDGRAQVYTGQVPTIASVVRKGLNIKLVDRAKNMLELLNRRERELDENGQVSEGTKKTMKQAYQVHRDEYEAFIAKNQNSAGLSPEEWTFFNKVIDVTGWAIDIIKGKNGTMVRANAEESMDALYAFFFGVGIGLARTEHLLSLTPRDVLFQKYIFSQHTVDLDTATEALNELMLLKMSDYAELFIQAANDSKGGARPVTFRLLDPPLHEFVPKDDEGYQVIAEMLRTSKENIIKWIAEMKAQEKNPMLGNRGVRLGMVNEKIIQVEAEAIAKAIVHVKSLGLSVNAEVMIPIVAEVREFTLGRDIFVTEARKHGLNEEDYALGTMIELPRGAMNVSDIVKAGAQFISLGTNDLTQTTHGWGRDDTGDLIDAYQAAGVIEIDPWKSMTDQTGRLARFAVEEARKANPDVVIKCGVCGEHGGDDATVKKYWNPLKLPYVSVGAGGILGAIFSSAQASLKPQKLKGRPIPEELEIPRHEIEPIPSIADAETLNQQFVEAVRHVQAFDNTASAKINAIANIDLTKPVEGEIENNPELVEILSWITDLKLSALPILREAGIDDLNGQSETTNGTGIVSTDQYFLMDDVRPLIQEYLVIRDEKKKNLLLTEIKAKIIQNLIKAPGFNKGKKSTRITFNLPELPLHEIFEYENPEDLQTALEHIKIQNPQMSETQEEIIGDIRNRIADYHEANPAIGKKGARVFFNARIAPLYTAISQALVMASEKKGYKHVNIMLPFVDFGKAVEKIRKGNVRKHIVPSLDDAINEAKSITLDVQIGAVLNTPGEVFDVEEIAEYINGPIIINSGNIDELDRGAFKVDAMKESGISNTYIERGIWTDNVFKIVPDSTRRFIQDAIETIKEHDVKNNNGKSTEIRLMVDYRDQKLIDLAHILGVSALIVAPENVALATIAAAQAAVTIASSPVKLNGSDATEAVLKALPYGINKAVVIANIAQKSHIAQPKVLDILGQLVQKRKAFIRRDGKYYKDASASSPVATVVDKMKKDLQNKLTANAFSEASQFIQGGQLVGHLFVIKFDPDNKTNFSVETTYASYSPGENEVVVLYHHNSGIIEIISDKESVPPVIVKTIAAHNQDAAVRAVIEIIKEGFDIAPDTITITPDSKFNELPNDSLSTYSIMGAIEEHFKIRIDISTILTLETVRDLIEVVMTQMELAAAERELADKIRHLEPEDARTRITSAVSLEIADSRFKQEPFIFGKDNIGGWLATADPGLQIFDLVNNEEIDNSRVMDRVYDRGYDEPTVLLVFSIKGAASDSDKKYIYILHNAKEVPAVAEGAGSSPVSTLKVRLTPTELDNLYAFHHNAWTGEADGGDFTLNKVGVMTSAVGFILNQLRNQNKRQPVNGKEFRVGLTFGEQKMSKDAAEIAAKVLVLAEGIQPILATHFLESTNAVALTDGSLGEEALDLVLHFDAPSRLNLMMFFERGTFTPNSLTKQFENLANDSFFRKSYIRAAAEDIKALGIETIGPSNQSGSSPVQIELESNRALTSDEKIAMQSDDVTLDYVLKALTKLEQQEKSLFALLAAGYSSTLSKLYNRVTADRKFVEKIADDLINKEAASASLSEDSSSPLQATSDEQQVTNPGGINLNPALLDLQIKRDGNGIPLPFNLQPIEIMDIEGFLPVIINVTPVINLPLLLGLADTETNNNDTTYNTPLGPMEPRKQYKTVEPELVSYL